VHFHEKNGPGAHSATENPRGIGCETIEPWASVGLAVLEISHGEVIQFDCPFGKKGPYPLAW